MATAEVRRVERQGAPGTEASVSYELGAEIDGQWYSFVRVNDAELSSFASDSGQDGGASSAPAAADTTPAASDAAPAQ